MKLDRHGLDRLADRLGVAFYFLALVAFLAAVTGSPGMGLFFLVLAGTVHVARAAIEEFVSRRGNSARLDLRLPSLGQLKPPQPARQASRGRPRR